MNDTEAIFVIVLRNLALPNWANLEPEAQSQTLEEAAQLMQSKAVPLSSKRNLSTRLDALRSYVTADRRERIKQLLDVCYKNQYN